MNTIYLASAWGRVRGRNEFMSIVMRGSFQEVRYAARDEFKETHGVKPEGVHINHEMSSCTHHIGRDR
jgi:hypothetical protein